MKELIDLVDRLAPHAAVVTCSVTLDRKRAIGVMNELFRLGVSASPRCKMVRESIQRQLNAAGNAQMITVEIQ